MTQKRIISILRCIAPLAILLLSLLLLASCSDEAKLSSMNEAERADFLFTKLSEHYSAENGYRIEQTGTVTYRGEELSGNGTVTGSTSVFGAGTENTRYLSSNTVDATITMGEEEYASKQTTTIGYLDGKMLYASEADGIGTKLCSPLTASEYEAYMIKMGKAETEFSLEDCSTLSSVKSEDGTVWALTLGGLSKEALQRMMPDLFSSIGTFDVTAFELTLTISAKEYQLVSAHASVTVATREDNQIDLTMEMQTEFTVTVLTSAEEVAAPADFSEYTETADLRYLDEATTAINAFISNKEEGCFVEKYITDGKTNDIERVDEYHFGRKDGKYVFYQSHSQWVGAKSTRTSFLFDGDILTITAYVNGISSDTSMGRTEEGVKTMFPAYWPLSTFAAYEVQGIRTEEADGNTHVTFELSLSGAIADALRKTSGGSLVKREITVTFDSSRTVTRYILVWENDKGLVQSLEYYGFDRAPNLSIFDED